MRNEEFTDSDNSIPISHLKFLIKNYRPSVMLYHKMGGFFRVNQFLISYFSFQFTGVIIGIFSAYGCPSYSAVSRSVISSTSYPVASNRSFPA